ncbi:MAG: hypothetical protein ABSE64_03055 [Vulcanimicrobiaceae bacterium]|jgi:hypothetical protein
MCTRTGGALAHVLEQQGLATVQLSSVRGHTERIKPPRALYCEFPFGRPLGKPSDAAFQRSVLMAAFALLERPAGPVLEDFPERVTDATEAPLTCALPPALSGESTPSVIDEARALRSAYERQLKSTGRTSVGITGDVDTIPALLQAFLKIAAGASPEEAGLPSEPHRAALDVRAYYEEAALALADHVPQARATESWFFQQTEAGKLLRSAQKQLIAAGRTDYLDTIVPRGQE